LALATIYDIKQLWQQFVCTWSGWSHLV